MECYTMLTCLQKQGSVSYFIPRASKFAVHWWSFCGQTQVSKRLTLFPSYTNSSRDINSQLTPNSDAVTPALPRNTHRQRTCWVFFFASKWTSNLIGGLNLHFKVFCSNLRAWTNPDIMPVSFSLHGPIYVRGTRLGFLFKSRMQSHIYKSGRCILILLY